MWYIGNNELYHWGVKGMKWRKHRAKSGMSDTERYARLAEGAAKSYDSVPSDSPLLSAYSSYRKKVKAEKKFKKKTGLSRTKKAAKSAINRIFGKKYSPVSETLTISDPDKPWKKTTITSRKKKYKRGTVTNKTVSRNGGVTYTSTKYTPKKRMK